MLRVFACGFVLALAASVSVAQDKRPRPSVVYAEEFNSGADPVGWTHRTVVTAPNQRSFLGEFANDTVKLTLRDLKKHDFVRVSLDLLILRSWDGTMKTTSDGTLAIGPDLWIASVENGPELLRAAFSNGDAQGTRRIQSYPGLIGERTLPRHGAVENNTLGYGSDSVYRLELIFPHQGAELTLCFRGEGLQDGMDETWGLDNFMVEALEAGDIAQLGPLEIARLTEQVTGNDLDKAQAAQWKLIGQGQRIVPILREIAGRPDGIDAARRQSVEQLLGLLDSEEYARRERATFELRNLMPDIAPLLEEARRKGGSPERCQRIEALLAIGREVGIDADARRRARIQRVLDILNPPVPGATTRQSARQEPGAAAGWPAR